MAPRNPAPEELPHPLDFDLSIEVLDSDQAGEKVVKGGVWRGGSYVLGALLTLAVVPLMTRHLGVADFGRLSLVTSIVFIVAGLTEAGLTSIGIREHALREGADARRRVVSNLVAMRTSLTIAGICLAAGICALAGYEETIVAGVLLSGISLLLLAAQQSYSVPLSTALAWGWWSALDLIRQALTALTILVLVLVGTGLVPFYLAGSIGGLVALVVTLIRFRHDIPWRPSFELAEWKELIRDALPYTAAATIGIMYFRVALASMGLIADPDETGYYSAAFKLVEPIGGIAWTMVNLAFPVLARSAYGNQERFRYALARLFEVGLILGGFLTLALLVSAPLAVEVVLGKDFDLAVPVLRIQGLTVMTTFVVATWAFGLLSLRRHGALLRANLLALVTAIGASLALVPSHGAEGAAVATLIAEIALVLVYGFSLLHESPELRPPLRVPLQVLAVTVAGACIWWLAPLPLLVEFGVIGFLYFGALAVLGAIPDEVWALLRRRGGND